MWLNMMTQTQNEFVKSYIAVWGEDEVERLLSSGFEPVLVTDGNMVKWVWHLTNGDNCAIVKPVSLLLPFEAAAD